jgi:hypothetical protein
MRVEGHVIVIVVGGHTVGISNSSIFVTVSDMA